MAYDVRDLDNHGVPDLATGRKHHRKVILPEQPPFNWEGIDELRRALFSFTLMCGKVEEDELNNNQWLRYYADQMRKAVEKL